MNDIVNEPVGFHLIRREVHPLKPAGGKAPALPETLVIAPGAYQVHGKVWRLSREGLYRFMFPVTGNQQRVVYRRDPLALLSALSWIASHGNRDNGLSVEDALAKARTEKLIVTCGNIAKVGVKVCEGAGLRARRVGSHTLDTLNTYNNGHALMELWLDGRWTLVDLDIKCLFVRNGRRLSLLEFSKASQRGDYKMEPLSAAVGSAVGHFTADGYDYGPLMETMFCTETELRLWYKRIMQIPVMIEEKKSFYTGTPAQLKKHSRVYPVWNETAMPFDAFVNRFYNEPGVSPIRHRRGRCSTFG